METTQRKIVIVEDEGLIAADLKGRLERAGYQVPAVASTAVEALAAIKEKSPDLVLMDIRLKGDVDGIQVAERVRRDLDVPVVYLTAYEDRKTLERASKTQAYGYIKKPIASASLQGSIEMALAKHRQDRYLREQRDWFSASFAAVADAVLVTDPAGRISYVNPAAEQLIGCKVDDALGRPSSELLRLQRLDGGPIDDLVPVCVLQGAPIGLPADTWLIDTSDRRRAIEGSLAPRWQEGRANGVVFTFKDVTLRRFEDEQSRQDGRHSALARLADGVAGQLDLELGVVAEESTRLLNSLPADSTLRMAAETIESAALDAYSVTCRLRAFGQEREIRPAVVRVGEILGELQQTWTGALPGLSVNVESNLRPVHADIRELTRILDMVLQHAHRWMETAGAIRMAAAAAEIDGLQEWVRVQMSYPTAGETAATMERVFDPSWDGNWEGLPFAYGLAKRMGGLLRAHVGPDQTATFELYLPSVEVAAAGAHIDPLERPVILLIERNVEVRRILHRHFEEHGYSVLEAANCGEALLLADAYEHPIRLIIANPAPEDEHREELTALMTDIKPGACVRIIEGYRQDDSDVDGSEQSWRYLTKWELLEWANEASGATVWLAASN